MKERSVLVKASKMWILMTRLKEKLLIHFAESGLQEQSDDKRIFLIFTEGIQNMLKETRMYHDYAEGHNL